MIRPEAIDIVMNEWPVQWYGKSSRGRAEGKYNLSLLKILWKTVSPLLATEVEQERHFRALWILGFELSRDNLLSSRLPSLPAEKRLRSMIEDGGPLLFSYHTTEEEHHFEAACETFEQALQDHDLWTETIHQHQSLDS